MNKRAGKILLSVLIVWACLSVAAFYFLLTPSRSAAPKEISYQQALTGVRDGAYSEIFIRSSSVEFTDKDNNKFVTYVNKNDAPVKALFEAAGGTGVQIRMEPASDGTFWIVLLNALPFLILIGFGAILTVGLFMLIMNSMIKNAVKTALKGRAADL